MVRSGLLKDQFLREQRKPNIGALEGSAPFYHPFLAVRQILSFVLQIAHGEAAQPSDWSVQSRVREIQLLATSLQKFDTCYHVMNVRL